ncbi:hypothetical protein Ssi03_76400 [Sphaerisporangium siamense]|uniref:Uncharacterized protein n=1 Tax=Sphaerisporangium siamense TaxID=795645 RepID=A0A7W7D5K6_9ACTN|nr:hypothetical protein [Sphaerisporangium siamense]GII89650.1 hypothetical protein Ssi03_76400 [Sphaerisporangium siamense]
MTTIQGPPAAPGRELRCRYRRRNDEMCSNPSLDQSPDALILICVAHAAKVMQLVAEQKAARLGRRRA